MPLVIGACAAMKVAIAAARSRSVPVAGSSHPKSDTAHRVQRASEAQRVADAAPIVFAVLVRSRTQAAGTRS